MDKQIHVLLSDWANWCVNYSEAQGYQNSTTVGRAMSGELGGSVYGCKIPNIMMTDRTVIEIDRVVKNLKYDDKLLIIVKYLLPGSEMSRIKVFCEQKNISKWKFYNMLDQIHTTIRGILSEDKNANKLKNKPLHNQK